MSSEAKVLKGGHPPAVKAGGMRITTKAHPQHLPTPEQKAEDQKFMEEEQISESLEEKPPNKILVSGATVKLNDIGKPESVKVYHDKPQPKIQKPVKQNNVPSNIQQPRKQ